MILISREDVQEMLNNTEELSAYAFKILDEELQEIPIRSVCDDSDVLRKVGDAMSRVVEKVDKFIEEERAFFRGFKRYKPSHRKKTKIDNNISRCYGCMGAAFGDCEDCERMQKEREEVER